MGKIKNLQAEIWKKLRTLRLKFGKDWEPSGWDLERIKNLEAEILKKLRTFEATFGHKVKNIEAQE